MNFSTLNTIGITGGVVAAVIGMSLGAMTAKADAASASQTLLTAYDNADGECRGSIHPLSRKTKAACARRGQISSKLEAIGWVYGWENVFGYCQEWHRPGKKPRSADCYFPD